MFVCFWYVNSKSLIQSFWNFILVFIFFQIFQRITTITAMTLLNATNHFLSNKRKIKRRRRKNQKFIKNPLKKFCLMKPDLAKVATYASSVILENKSDELQPLVFELTSFFLQFEQAATLLLDVELIILDCN